MRLAALFVESYQSVRQRAAHPNLRYENICHIGISFGMRLHEMPDGILMLQNHVCAVQHRPHRTMIADRG